MGNYYSENLSAERLKRAYEIATPRLNQYLEAEIEHILKKVKSTDTILEIGCGYGRIMKRLLSKVNKVVGIDVSLENIRLAKEYLKDYENAELFQMDASHMNFEKHIFDVVIVAQNGISAFKVPPKKLLKECLNVTKKRGLILFSTYSDKFWFQRLKWFEMQAEEGLVGEIDCDKTKNGEIICKDGFKATTFTPDQFISLANNFDISPNIIEVDESSLFCEIKIDKFSQVT